MPKIIQYGAIPKIIKNGDKNNHTIQTDVKFESENKSQLLLLLYHTKNVWT